MTDLETPEETAARMRRVDSSIARQLASALERIGRLRLALEKCAAFHDTGAEKHLEATGSYGEFDEPAAARIAREALKDDA